MVDSSRRGSVEVGYTADKPHIDEGPFLTEERRLIDTIANELSFIIEQRLYNEEKTRLRDQLRHADRLATIGQLAAGVAHELNEPLSNILGFAQLVVKDEGISEQSGRDIEKIIAGTLHARQIIKELLIFARETEPVKVSFNLNELINDGLFFLESRFKKVGIDLDCRLAPDLPGIKADRLQILQVLTNLVVNAVQAMPGGGQLTIRTAADSGTVELIVKDTGVGIDKSIIKDIFNPFFTTKDVSEGTGLGLSVVHGIVTAHQGTISVESAVGEGSTFTIRLPVDTAESGTGDERT
jgi:signal transduction histidine kinase